MLRAHGAGAWHKSLHRQPYNHALPRIQTALYRGQDEIAWQLVTETWRDVDRALITHVLFNASRRGNSLEDKQSCHGMTPHAPKPA
jgi:hypothetical protein